MVEPRDHGRSRDQWKSGTIVINPKAVQAYNGEGQVIATVKSRRRYHTTSPELSCCQNRRWGGDLESQLPTAASG
jgi:hypothetical protein